MSTQVAFAPSARVGATTKPMSGSSCPVMSSSKVAKLSRLRQAPPKPQIAVDKTELKKKLTPLQFKVTQEKFTERAFSGELLKLNDAGKYCCIVCGEELFSSQCKFDSGCGWPAFSDVVQNDKVILQADLSHVGGNLLLLALNQDLARTEVTCAKCGAHLGHVFDDGPKPTCKRYCVNSSSLRFEKQPDQNLSTSSDTSLTPVRSSTTMSSSASSTSASYPTLVNPSNSPSQTAMLSKTKMARNGISDTEVKEGKSQVTGQRLSEKIGIQNTLPKTEPQTGPKTTVSRSDETVLKSRRLFFGSNQVISQRKGSAVEPVQGPSDANNNRIGGAKYSSVKSRYLDHLNSVSKEAAERHTTSKFLTAKPLLETHL